MGWQPTFLGRLKGAAIAALSSNTIERLLAVMNDKQNKSMRQLLFERFHAESARTPRRMLFVRLQNDWGDVVGGLPRSRVEELGLPRDAQVPAIEAALANVGVDLVRARELYAATGGCDGWRAVNRVTTGFTALTDDELATLEGHARWQVHALVALYGTP